MGHPNREDIHIFNKYTNISSSSVRKAFEDRVYNTASAWNQFAKWTLLALGVGFTISGIVFFFAYNWADLNKFLKFGLVQTILILSTCCLWFFRGNVTRQQIILTGMSVITGLLFALFGQVYQTGADAYDFFLSWVIFITLWVFVSRFAPLWLIYLILINTTIVLYKEQIASHWNFVFLMFVLVFFNSVCLLAGKMNIGKKVMEQFPTWFENTIALFVCILATFGIFAVIFEPFNPINTLLSILVVVLYLLALLDGFRNKRVFYIALVSLSLIIISSAILLKISDGYIMLLAISIFIICTITLAIRYILELQKKWSHG